LALSALKRVTVTAAAAAGIFVFLPTGSASAIDHVDCGTPGATKLSVHLHNRPTVDECYQNPGTWDFAGRVFLDTIYVGDRDVEFRDCDGPVVRFSANTATTFPNRPPCMDTFTIL
jgi:hypothetical protein